MDGASISIPERCLPGSDSETAGSEIPNHSSPIRPTPAAILEFNCPNPNPNTSLNKKYSTNAIQSPIIREQDYYLPITNLVRIMRKALPPHAKITDEAKELIQASVSEYIAFITSEANDHCLSERRKTITAEDIIWAMCTLGFDDYVKPLSVFLEKHRVMEGSDRRGSIIRGSPINPTVCTAGDESVSAGLCGLPLQLQPPYYFNVQPSIFLQQFQEQQPPPPFRGLGDLVAGRYAGMLGNGDGDGLSSAQWQIQTAGFDPFDAL